MKAEQKAVIARAEREGLAPSEISAELLTHDLLTSALGVIRGHAVAFKNMSEQQQDACIATMEGEFKQAVDRAVRIIAGAGTKTVRMKLQKVAIGKNYQIQGVAGSSEEHLHALCDKAQDQSDVLIVLYESDYHQGLDVIQGEKDQKDLPLDNQKQEPEKPRPAPAKKGASAKPVELTQAVIEDARQFVSKFQNPTMAGLQNHLKCNIDKARAIHDVLAAEGILTTEANERGDRQMVRKESAKPEPKVEVESVGGSDYEAALSNDLYVKAKSAVISSRRVSSGFLQDELGIDEDTAGLLLGRLEDDGVVSEENEMGGRTILIAA